eukprot:CAMPEP_0118665532 /NCGR_PEP_ID=MMETSP0785-20121206/18674_1 /TAXON_ID=91992 /ORGANISM="Bolidomonas pacifica, Strain CCMP 1866" /LENGTH=489 /DNA_ID=CAMNT_0006559667 /DNA_START=1356 /DNA_END=2823 /DNA_ORIENTATION=-
MTLWRNFAKHIEETKARMDRGVAKVNRVRLSSAFMGLRISVSEGRSVRKITKLMFHVARRMVMKALYTWKVGTVRMRFLSGRAKDMQRQVIVKAKTKSFDVWKSVSKKTRFRNSSLDHAASIGVRGINKHHFYRWVKSTRYLRVMSHCESVNEWIKQKYFFKLRVYAFKWQKMIRMRLSGLCGLVSRKHKILAFAKWRRLYTLKGMRCQSLQGIFLAFTKTLQGIGFARWLRILRTEDISRLRTESEVAMTRLRSDSSLELVRQNEKYLALAQEGGWRRFVLRRAKSVQGNITLVELGWRRWKMVYWRTKEMQVRRETLLHRVAVSRMRRAFNVMARNSRLVLLENHKEHCLKKIFRLLEAHLKRKAFDLIHEAVRRRDHKERIKAIGQCRAISHFVQLGYANKGADYQLRKMWHLWVVRVRGVATMEIERERFEREEREKATNEIKRVKEMHKGEVGKVKQELENLKKVALPYLSRANSNARDASKTA